MTSSEIPLLPSLILRSRLGRWGAPFRYNWIYCYFSTCFSPKRTTAVSLSGESLSPLNLHRIRQRNEPEKKILPMMTGEQIGRYLNYCSSGPYQALCADFHAQLFERGCQDTDFF